MKTMRVYGSKISYFTGKLESYLRYKGIAYERLPMLRYQKLVRRELGTTQMPAVELDDGRWMSDSTPIIQYLERQFSAAPVLPEAPVLCFIALLIEDYADEWLWRPAMHYRWSFRHDRELLSSIIVDELMGHIPAPRFVKKRMITRRQRNGFVIGDGVSDATCDHVESGYITALGNMTQMLAGRRFLLGDSPSIADIGLMGPMLRHFGQDPTPTELMRERAPAVYAWVARMWNAKASSESPVWLDAVPEDAQPMLQEICETHLQQLAENAEAFRKDIGRFGMKIQGCVYQDLPVSRYRVWCLEELRKRFDALSDDEQGRVRSLLAHPGAEILWTADGPAPSGYDKDREAPFNRAINVYANGVPR
jgi:glutathione S-transferase